MRSFRTRVLLASVLAIGAQLAGCGDTTDCPSAVADHTSCSTSGLSCFAGAEQCTCTGGLWQCQRPDMSIHDLSPHPDDLPKPVD
ncbi:MAG: hypothetical protein JWN44_3324 [Myxococcales bacterium]|nr:hypothetical protein [Myxococcales bacterium]